jgi:hypothetical protein
MNMRFRADVAGNRGCILNKFQNGRENKVNFFFDVGSPLIVLFYTTRLMFGRSD